MGGIREALLGMAGGAAKAVYSNAEIEKQAEVEDAKAAKQHDYRMAEVRQRAQDELSHINRRHTLALDRLKAQGKQTTTENIRKEGVSAQAASASLAASRADKKAALEASRADAATKHQYEMERDRNKPQKVNVYNEFGQVIGQKVVYPGDNQGTGQPAPKPPPKPPAPVAGDVRTAKLPDGTISQVQLGTDGMWHRYKEPTATTPPPAAQGVVSTAQAAPSQPAAPVKPAVSPVVSAQTTPDIPVWNDALSQYGKPATSSVPKPAPTGIILDSSGAGATMAADLEAVSARGKRTTARLKKVQEKVSDENRRLLMKGKKKYDALLKRYNNSKSAMERMSLRKQMERVVADYSPSR